MSDPAAMASDVPAPGFSLSLEQWVALNDEIGALVRSGLPLEQGLMGASGDLSGRLRSVTRALADRLERGDTLGEALAAEAAALPPVYRAVVTAGARSGRLDTALQGLADTVRQQIEMRRSLGLALIYPMIVIALAYTMFVGFITLLLPRFLETFAAFRLPSSRVLNVLARFGETAWLWWPVGPILLLLLLVAWVWSGRARAYPHGGLSLLRWVPWMRSMARESSTAAFADLAALLLEHQVPLAEAVELASLSSGDARLIQASESLAAGARRGEAELGSSAGGFPPLLRWLISYGQRQGMLAPSLRQAADSYRRRALMHSQVIRTFLPILLTVIIGGSAVVFYALTLFLPFSTLMSRLSDSMNY